jgi:hypothetical protein
MGNSELFQLSNDPPPGVDRWELVRIGIEQAQGNCIDGWPEYALGNVIAVLSHLYQLLKPPSAKDL